MIWYLLAGTVDYMSNFVCHYEFLILSSKWVSDEKTIFNFNGTYHILWKLLIHSIHLLLHKVLLVLVIVLLYLPLVLLIGSRCRTHSHHFLLLLLRKHLRLFTLYYAKISMFTQIFIISKNVTNYAFHYYVYKFLRHWVFTNIINSLNSFQT